MKPCPHCGKDTEELTPEQMKQKIQQLESELARVRSESWRKMVDDFDEKHRQRFRDYRPQWFRENVIHRIPLSPEDGQIMCSATGTSAT